MQPREIEALYRAHGHVVLRRARRIMSSEDDAREIVQEVFASLLDNPGQLRGQGSVTTWLYSAATHGCLNRLRNQRTQRRLLSVQPPPQESTGPLAESAAMLRQLLARIPEELAQAAVHYYSDEMTQDEIATVMGCSRRHVGDLLARLRAHVETSQERA